MQQQNTEMHECISKRLCVVVFQVCYAKELKEGFVEYTEQVVKLMVPLLKFYFHDDILLSQTSLICSCQHMYLY